MLPISNSQTVYFYAAATDGSNCANNLRYDITINQNPIIDRPTSLTSCGSYFLPALTNGDYYYFTNGAGGIVPPLTEISSTRTLFVFKNSGTCTSQHQFIITIKTPVLLDGYPADQYICNINYILPIITRGKYYTGPAGTGTELAAGTAITSTTLVYIYNNVLPDATFCPAEHFFNVFINYINVGVIANVNQCDTYTLPALTTGAYFNAADGVNPLTASQLTITPATSPKTFYVYASKGTAPRNCISQTNFVVAVSATPTADNPADVEVCDSYTLPALSANNNYFSQMIPPFTAKVSNEFIFISKA